MKQHWVPRSYLEAWADPATATRDNPLVWAFRCEDRKLFSPSVKNIFAETHFYTITRRDGTRDTSLEERFAILEGNFVGARERLRQGAQPSSGDEGVFAAYAALMHARSQRMRDHHRSQFKTIAQRMEEIEKLVRRGVKIPVAPASTDNRRSLTRDHVDFVVENTGAIIVPPFTRAEAMVYAAMERATLKADGEAEFITSDSPCVWLDKNARPGLFGAPSLLSQGLEVYMPISPELCSVWSHRPDLAGVISVDGFIVQQVNLWIAAHSEVLVSTRPLFARALLENPVMTRAIQGLLGSGPAT
jgi:hypothetical protein